MSAWILIGLGVLIVCLLGTKGKPSGGKKPGKPTRIDHLHYIDLDEYECSVCGHQFDRKSMTCPKCGARFAAMENAPVNVPVGDEIPLVSRQIPPVEGEIPPVIPPVGDIIP